MHLPNSCVFTAHICIQSWTLIVHLNTMYLMAFNCKNEWIPFYSLLFVYFHSILLLSIIVLLSINHRLFLFLLFFYYSPTSDVHFRVIPLLLFISVYIRHGDVTKCLYVIQVYSYHGNICLPFDKSLCRWQLFPAVNSSKDTEK